MLNKNGSHLQVGATTLISKATDITGELGFSGNLEVEGTLNGNIIAREENNTAVRIQAGARVVGKIEAPFIIINGQVEGDVICTKHLELAAQARIKGNVYYNYLEVVKGAQVNGKMVHQAAGQKAEAQPANS